MRKTTIHEYQCDICKQAYEDKAQMNEVKITTYSLNAYSPRLKKYGNWKKKLTMCIYCKKDIDDYIKGLKKLRESDTK